MALLYTLEEAAGILGISPGELRAKAQSREVPAILCSGTWKLRSNVVNDLASRRSAAGAARPTPQPAARVAEPAITAPATTVAAAPAPRVESTRVAAPPRGAPAAPVTAAPPKPAVAPPPAVVAAPPSPRPTPVVAAPLAPPPSIVVAAPPTPPPATVVPTAALAPVDATECMPVDLLDVEAFNRLIQPPPGASALLVSPLANPTHVADSGQTPTELERPKIDFSVLDVAPPPELPAPEAESKPIDAAPIVERPKIDFSVLDVAPPPTQDDAKPSEDDDEEDSLFEAVGLPPGERAPAPPRVVTCPNEACRTPGLVPAQELARPMRCKVCATDFYWDPATDTFKIGLHPTAAWSGAEAARRRPVAAAAGAVTTMSSPYKYRRWNRRRVLRTARAVAALTVVGVIATVALSRYFAPPATGNQVQEHAAILGKALCRNDTSAVASMVDARSSFDAKRWLGEVRPTSWPASDEKAIVEVDVKYARVKSGTGACEIHVWPAPDEAGVAVTTLWVVAGDGQWRLNGSDTIKAKSHPLPKFNLASSSSRPDATKGRGAGSRKKAATKTPVPPSTPSAPDAP